MEDTSLNEIASNLSISPPSPEQWAMRRTMVTGISMKFYNALKGTQPPDKFMVLERELEHCYCSGAYLACIVFAQALVEMLMKDVNDKARKEMDEKLEYISDEIDWLKKTRNRISHYMNAADPQEIDEYVLHRSAMEYPARKSVGLVYHVARVYAGLDPKTAYKGTRRDPSRQANAKGHA